MDMKEHLLLAKLAENKRIGSELATELAEYRHSRAKDIRHQYFTQKRTQTDIARSLGMAQGSVSRIVSDFSCVDIREQLIAH